jgi:hypothetical protein
MSARLIPVLMRVIPAGNRARFPERIPMHASFKSAAAHPIAAAASSGLARVCGFFLALPFSLAHADAVPEPPLEENKLGMSVFALLFVGFCVGLVWYVWRNERRAKKEAEAEKHPAAK